MSESFRFRNACAARTLIDWLFSSAVCGSQTAVLQFHAKQPVECWDGRRWIKGKKAHTAARVKSHIAKQTVSRGGERADVRFSFASLINGWLSTHYVSPFGHVNRVCIIDCSFSGARPQFRELEITVTNSICGHTFSLCALSHLIRRRMQRTF